MLPGLSRSRPPTASDVVEHLSADLTPEARATWAGLVPLEADTREGLHDRVRAHVTAVVRALRHTRPGVPLHAGACALEGEVCILLPGRSGAGKSTLVAALTTRGAEAVSDDTVWVEGCEVSGVGAPMALRRGNPMWQRASELWHADDSERLLVRPSDLSGSSRLRGHISWLIYPTHAPDGGSSQELSAAESFCRLVSMVMRRLTDQELLALAALTSSRPSASITYHDSARAIELCTGLVERHQRSPAVEPQQIHSDVLRGAGFQPDIAGIQFGEDAALWRPSATTVICLRSWTGSERLPPDTASELQALGFLPVQEHQP